jgi:hypothetical protein
MTSSKVGLHRRRRAVRRARFCTAVASETIAATRTTVHADMHNMAPRVCSREARILEDTIEVELRGWYA